MTKNLNPTPGTAPQQGADEFGDLIARIQTLPEAEPPPDFSAQVMARLALQQPSLTGRVRQLLQAVGTPRWTFSLTPLKLGAAAMVLLAALMVLRHGAIPGFHLHFQSAAEPLNLAEGIALLEAQRFAEAQAWFAQRHGRAAGAAALNYYLGRSHLALAQPRQALTYFQQALETEGNRPEYHFWLGLCHYALEAPSQELAGYRRALELDPDFLPAHLYAGHHHMDQQQWQAALSHYQKVLQTVPDHAQALFNSAVALHHLDPGEAENQFWRAYLSRYSAGPQALAAVARLNANGDFSYRSHRLGTRRWVLRAPRFAADGCQILPEDQALLQLLGSQLMAQIPEMVLHIVGYAEGNAPLAHCRVRQIKRNLMARFPDLPAEQIRLSWFGVPERVPQGEGVQELKESIQMFTLPVNLNSV